MKGVRIRRQRWFEANLRDPAAISRAVLLADVFEPGYLRRLDRLRLHVQQSLATRPGNTPMPRGTQASGLELANYKNYGLGDDLRYLDWNAYGRLDQLLIKTFRAEREAALHVFVDCSASMAVPASDGKFPFALSVAASLAYVSLRHNDPVRFIALSADGAHCYHASPWFRHRGLLILLRDYLASLRAVGPTTLAEGLREYADHTRVPGVAVLLSDFLTEPAQHESALRGLAGRGWTISALRLLGPAERDPTELFRRGRLRDSETGAERVITLTTANASRYEAALQNHLDRLRKWCHQHEILFATIDPGTGLERTMFHDLRACGIVR